MKLSRLARRRLSTTALAAGPVALIVLVRAMAGSGPTAAPAAHPAPSPLAAPAPALPDAPVAAPGTAAQQKALAWARSHSGVRAASPMDHPKAEAAVAVDESPTRATPVGSSPERTPVVSAIVRRGDSAKALIDGKVVGIGDEVMPGWVVSAIDVREQIVTISGPEGTQRELSGRRSSGRGESAPAGTLTGKGRQAPPPMPGPALPK